MPTRAAMLTGDFHRRRSALLGALEGHSYEIKVRTLWSDAGRADEHGDQDLATPAASASAPALGGPGVPTRTSPRGSGHGSRSWPGALSAVLARLPFGPAIQFAAYRPDLVISEGFGIRTLQAALYRFLSRRSRLLLCATEPPRRFNMCERMILSRADGVLADGEDVAYALERLRFPASRIVSVPASFEVEAFLSCPRTRSGPEAYRLVYAGDLSPQSGVADFLICVAAWAEQHPERPIEVWWIGDGDLSGVLEAQPLPDTMSQRFLGHLDALGMAAAFVQCGVLAVPSLGDDKFSPVPEALAAGLVVLGSKRNRWVRQLVREDLTGWTFDPLRPDDMLQALDRALASSAEALDQMRESGRAVVRPSASQGFADRFRRAIAVVLPDSVFEPQPAASATGQAQ